MSSKKEPQAQEAAKELEIFEKIENFISGFFQFIGRYFGSIYDMAVYPSRFYKNVQRQNGIRYVRPFTFLVVTTFSLVKGVRVIMLFLSIGISASFNSCSHNPKESIQVLKVPEWRDFLEVPPLIDLLIVGLPIAAIVFLFSIFARKILFGDGTSGMGKLIGYSSYTIGFQLILILVFALLITQFGNTFKHTWAYTVELMAFACFIIIMSAIFLWKCLPIFYSRIRYFLKVRKFSQGVQKLNYVFGTIPLLALFCIPPLVFKIIAPENNRNWSIQISVYTVIVLVLSWPLLFFVRTIGTSFPISTRRVGNRIFHYFLLTVAGTLLCSATLAWEAWTIYNLVESDLEKKPVLIAASVKLDSNSQGFPELSLLVTNNSKDGMLLLGQKVSYFKVGAPEWRYRGEILLPGQKDVSGFSLAANASIWMRVSCLSVDSVAAKAFIPDSAIGLIGLSQIETNGTVSDVYVNVRGVKNKDSRMNLTASPIPADSPIPDWEDSASLSN